MSAQTEDPPAESEADVAPIAPTDAAAPDVKPGGAPAHANVLRVDKLRLRGFRNLASTDLEPGAAFNVIHGDNGAGKSNLLEALHYLGALRSFRGARTEDMLSQQGDEAILRARVSGEAAPRAFSIQLQRSKARTLVLDAKRPRSISRWHQAIQVVLFHPGDLRMAIGGPEARRTLLDRILEQMDPTYTSTLATYTKALRSRNRLLKKEDVDRRSITAFDQILAEAGAVVGQTRARLADELAPSAERAFEEVIGESVPLEIRYQHRVPPDPEEILRALHAAYEKDRARGFTADGPHGDDLVMRVQEVVAKHHASQGQHRAIVLALKVAELDVLTRSVGRVPLLLLDDVSSELDRARNRRFFQLLANLGGQVFLTTTHPEFILLEQNRVDFHVEAGVITRD